MEIARKKAREERAVRDEEERVRAEERAAEEARRKVEAEEARLRMIRDKELRRYQLYPLYRVTTFLPNPCLKIYQFC